MAHAAFRTHSLHPEMHVKDTSASAVRQEGRSSALEFSQKSFEVLTLWPSKASFRLA